MPRLWDRCGIAPALIVIAASWCSLGAGAALSETMGFDPASVARFVEKRVDPDAVPKSRRGDRLRAAAHLFRRFAVMSPALLVPAFGLARPQGLDRLLLSPGALRAPMIWRHFFYGSLVHITRVSEPVSRVGFYNVHSDGWVVTDWRWDGDRPILVALRVTTGETMRGKQVAALLPIAWARSLLPPKALQEVVRQGANKFAESRPIKTGTALERSEQAVVEFRLLAALKNIARHDRTDALAAATDALLAAIQSGDPTAIASLTTGVPAQAIHRLASLPKAMRDGLELNAAYPIDGGTIVSFAMPMVSRWLVMAYYRLLPKRQRATVAGLVVLDLGRTPRQKAER